MPYSKPNSIAEDYELREEIGHGSYSICRLAIHKASRTEWAVKVTLISVMNYFEFIIKFKINHNVF